MDLPTCRIAGRFILSRLPNESKQPQRPNDNEALPDIAILLSENFDSGEHRETKNLLKLFGTVGNGTFFRAAYQTLKPFAIIIVTFASGRVANRFFTKMRVDESEDFKKAFVVLLTRERKPADQPTTLEYVFPYYGLEIHAFPETRRAEIVERAHTNSEQIMALLKATSVAKKLPLCADHIELRFDALSMVWKFRTAMGLLGTHFATFRFNDSTDSWETTGSILCAECC